jgi:hypothetical protein
MRKWMKLVVAHSFAFSRSLLAFASTAMPCQCWSKFIPGKKKRERASFNASCNAAHEFKARRIELFHPNTYSGFRKI